MIVSMIYKSAIENGTADVLLDWRMPAISSEAEGWAENGLPPGVPESGRMVADPAPVAIKEV